MDTFDKPKDSHVAPVQDTTIKQCPVNCFCNCHYLERFKCPPGCYCYCHTEYGY